MAPASDVISGRATADGTARYAARHAPRFTGGFYRRLAGLSVASLGLGTSRGACDDADDAAYEATLIEALSAGVNIIDTAINYRCQRSERTLGRALRFAIRSGLVARDEVVVCTKGGFVPTDGANPSSGDELKAYLTREWIERGVFTMADLARRPALHCLAPAFIADQLSRSRANLGVETVDVYYVHNPEHHVAAFGAARTYELLRAVFELLESRCSAGEIAVYGCATWSGFRVEPGHAEHVSVAELVRIARDVGGDAHHFRVVQTPLSSTRDEAARLSTQPLDDGRIVPLLEAAAALNLAVVGSGALSQGALVERTSEALGFVRSLPIASALVGTKSREHLASNLEAFDSRETVVASSTLHPAPAL